MHADEDNVLFVMDTGQSDAALEQALLRVDGGGGSKTGGAVVGCRRAPPTTSAHPHHCEYHAGLIWFLPNGEMKRRKLNQSTTTHEYIAYEDTKLGRQQQEQYHRAAMTSSQAGLPQRDNGGSEFETEVQIGESFQAVVPAWQRKAVIESSASQYDQIWHPQQCEIAASQQRGDGETIDFIMAGNLGASTKFRLMDVLHHSQYDVEKAKRQLAERTKLRGDETMDLSAEEKVVYEQLITKLIGTDKEFKEAANRIGCSKEKVLVNYYRWKGKTRGFAVYQEAKEARTGVPGSPVVLLRSSMQQRAKKTQKDLLSDRLLELKGLHKELLTTQHRPAQDMPIAGTGLLQRFTSEQLNSDNETASISNEEVPSSRSESDEEYVDEGDANYSEEEDQPAVLPAPHIKKDQTRPKPTFVNADKQNLRDAYRSDVSSVRNTPGAFFYTANIPILAGKGLQIEVAQVNAHVVFAGYHHREGSNDIGPAEKNNVFVSIGDTIVAVDGIKCTQERFEEVVKRLAANTSTGSKRLRMVHQPASQPTSVQNEDNILPSGDRLSRPQWKGQSSNKMNGSYQSQPPPCPPPPQCPPPPPSQRRSCDPRDTTFNAGYGQRQTHYHAPFTADLQHQIPSGTSSQMRNNSHGVLHPHFVAQPQYQNATAIQTAPPTTQLRNPNIAATPDPRNSNMRKVDIHVTVDVDQDQHSPETMCRMEALNSNALASFWAEGLADFPGFFARRGLITIDDLLRGDATVLANELSKEKQIPYDEARDVVGIIRVKLTGLLTTRT